MSENNSAETKPEQTKPEQTKPEQTKPEQTKPGQKNPANGVTPKANNGAETFDWVTERSSCSLPKVFNTLRMQVEEDVKTRNSLRPNASAYEFFVTHDTGEFAAVLKAQELQKSVTFRLADNTIQVRDDQGAQMFEVTLTFDDAGNCRLNVNAQERDFWQVRRMALEDLMYRGL